MLATADPKTYLAPTKTADVLPQVIVVTGGAGYIGVHVIDQLLSYGFGVVVIDDLSTGLRENLDKLTPTSTQQLGFYEGDFADTNLWQLITSKYKVLAVVHLAGKIDATESLSSPDLYLEENYLKTQTLVELLQTHQINNLVFASTAAVYGNCAEYPITEQAPLAPLNPYGESKMLAEQAIQKASLRSASDAASPAFNAVCLRFFNAAGTSSKLQILPQNPNGLLQQLKAVIAGSGPIFSIYGDDYDTSDGTCIRDFVSVVDIARAVAESVRYLIQHTQPIFLIFNVGSGHGYSVKQILETAQKIVTQNGGEQINFRISPRRANEIPISVADNKLIKITLNFDLQSSDLETILRTSL